MEAWKKIKTQIQEQSRPSLGHVDTNRRSGMRIIEPPAGPPAVGIPIAWTRMYYVFDRGLGFIHTPETYRQFTGHTAIRVFSGNATGGITENNNPIYGNYHYGVKILSTSDTTISLPINIPGASISVYSREFGRGAYTLLASQLVSSPFDLRLILRSSVWTELHLFVYLGRADISLAAFQGINRCVQAAQEIDFEEPEVPVWTQVPIVTALLDPQTGASINMLSWYLPTTDDWAGHGIYREEDFTNYEIQRVMPSGQYTPTALANYSNINVISISGTVSTLFQHGSIIEFSGTGSGSATILHTYDQPANVVPYSNFIQTNSSGFPQGWVVLSGTNSRMCVVTGGPYGCSVISGYHPAGTASHRTYTTSGFITIDPTTIYQLSVVSNPVTAGLPGAIRLVYYDASYNPMSATGYSEFQISNTNTGYYTQYNWSVGPAGTSGYNTIWPAACAYAKVALYPYYVLASGGEGYYGAIRMAQEEKLGRYAYETYDTTHIIISGLPSITIASGAPVYQHSFRQFFERQRQPSDTERNYLTWDDISVRHGESYTYYLDCFDAASNRSALGPAASIVSGDTVAPAHVTALTGYRNTSRSHVISWLNPEDEDLCGVTIWSGTTTPVENGDYPIASVIAAPSTPQSFMIGDIGPNRTNTFWVTPWDRNLNENFSPTIPSITITGILDEDSDSITMLPTSPHIKAGASQLITMFLPHASTKIPVVSVADTLENSILTTNSTSGVSSKHYETRFTVTGGTANGVAHAHTYLLADNGRQMRGSCSFVVDTAAPTVNSFNMQSLDGYIYETHALLTITATDSGSGLKDMVLTEDSSFAGSTYIPYSTQYTYTFTGTQYGNRVIYCKVRDQALNESDIVSATGIYDVSRETNYLWNSSFEKFNITITGVPIGLIAQGTPTMFSGTAAYGNCCIGVDQINTISWLNIYCPPYDPYRDMILSWYSRSSKEYRAVFDFTFYDKFDNVIGSTLTIENAEGENKDYWQRFYNVIEAGDLLPYASAAYMQLTARGYTFPHAPEDRVKIDAVQLEEALHEKSLLPSLFMEPAKIKGGNIIATVINTIHIDDLAITPPKLDFHNPDYGHYTHYNDDGFSYNEPSVPMQLPYVKGLYYIDPALINCGTRQGFNEFGLGTFTKKPQVILIPARMQTWDKSSSNYTYISLNNIDITTSSMLVRPMLYVDPATAYSYNITSGFASDLYASSDHTMGYQSTNSLTKGTSDVLVYSSGTWNTTTIIDVYYSIQAQNFTDRYHPSGYRCGLEFCLWTHPATGVLGIGSWPATPTALTQSSFQAVTYWSDGRTYSGIFTVTRTVPSSYAVKIDCFQREPDDNAYNNPSIYIDAVKYTATSGPNIITGTGIVGAMLFVT